MVISLSRKPLITSKIINDQATNKTTKLLKPMVQQLGIIHSLVALLKLLVAGPELTYMLEILSDRSNLVRFILEDILKMNHTCNHEDR